MEGEHKHEVFAEEFFMVFLVSGLLMANTLEDGIGPIMGKENKFLEIEHMKESYINNNIV